MYIIKYKEKVMTNHEEQISYDKQYWENEQNRYNPDGTLNKDFQELLPFTPKYVLRDSKYSTETESDRDYWLDVIQKTYGEYGTVTIEECTSPKDPMKSETLREDLDNTMLALTELYETILVQEGV